jgi:hypothetical protein
MRPITNLLLLTTALARGVDYLSELPDVGRTGWLRDEKVYTKANVKDSKLLSKVKLDTAPRVKCGRNINAAEADAEMRALWSELLQRRHVVRSDKAAEARSG